VPWLRWLGARSRVKPKALAVFTRELATLLDAGMPLLRGLRILDEQERHPALKRAIRELAEAIESGETFSEGLARCPKVFDPLYVTMTRAGEAGGVLDVVLDRLATFMEKAERIKGKVIAGLFYPITVLIVAAGILALMLAFIVPRFEGVFADLMGGRPMPAFTRFVLGLSSAVQHHWLAVAVGIVAAVATSRLIASTRPGRRLLDRVKLHLPVLGPVITKAAISRFSRTLGTLVSSGVPILQALTIVRDTVGNTLLSDAVTRVHQSVKEGETVTVPLRASGVFPAVVVGMVDIGEQTGALPDMLMKVADKYDDEVDNAVSAMTSLLEPLMIVFLAVMVGGIVIAMFLPIIEIINGGLNGPGGADDNI
jgi:type IV pilus assembly protein PilC